MEIEKIRDRSQPSFPLNDRIFPVEQVPRGDHSWIKESQKISFHRGSSPVKRRWRLMAWSLAAGFIDILMMFSMTCFVTGALVFAMSWKLTLNQVVHTQSLQLALGITLIGFYAMYLLTLRVFLGCTLGEWACGLRLGEPRHRLSPGYSLRVHFRLIVTVLTGVVTLPLLSLLFGVDLAGKLSGLPLVSYNTK